MSKVIFNFNGMKTVIQCNTTSKMEDICKKFISKIGKDINTINFLYNGEKIDFSLTFYEQANIIDRKANEMNVLVYEKLLSNIKDDNLPIKSKEIICPKCWDNCRINIQNYKIKLFGCKNGHEIDNILLNEFDNSQNINESKIICNICNKISKNKAHNRTFYKCLTCQLNICPLCNSIHDKNHKIIDYDKKNYICKIHKDSYISYCEKCKINLCFQCEELHKSHQIISFRSIFPNINEIKEEIKKFKSLIDNFKNKIKQIISILNKTIFCIENYYNINYSIINNFEIQEKNYQVLQNINEVNKNIKTSKNNIILNEEDICNTFKYIFQIYNQMVKKDFFSNKKNKLNELKNSNKDISDEINKNVNTSKKEFDISIYEKKGYSKEEILDCKEAFDTFDSEKIGKINANELIT